MTTPKAKLAGLALVATLCAGFTLGLTAPASAGWDEGVVAYDRGDFATANREWRPLAKQGMAEAQYNLGVMYSYGRGVPQDYVQAHMWLSLAASRHPPGEDRDQSVKNRDTIAEWMTPAQIAEAQKLAREWKEKHKSGEAQTVAVYLPPKPEGDGTPRCLTGATFGPIAEDSPLFGGVIRIQVVDVERDSLAWKMGLREHDSVVMVNGELVRDLDEFAAATRKRGGSLILKVLSRSFTRAWWYIGGGFFSVVC
ncbi:MAG: SEL1-like repeat protein [Proteobacteria bacterium]|nr:SEL1-like repeat protein [Pseudomonadota bacterium]